MTSVVEAQKFVFDTLLRNLPQQLVARSRSIHLTPASPVCFSVGVGWNT